MNSAPSTSTLEAVVPATPRDPSTASESQHAEDEVFALQSLRDLHFAIGSSWRAEADNHAGEEDFAYLDFQQVLTHREIQNCSFLVTARSTSASVPSNATEEWKALAEAKIRQHLIRESFEHGILEDHPELPSRLDLHRTAVFGQSMLVRAENLLLQVMPDEQEGSPDPLPGVRLYVLNPGRMVDEISITGVSVEDDVFGYRPEAMGLPRKEFLPPAQPSSSAECQAAVRSAIDELIHTMTPGDFRLPPDRSEITLRNRTYTLALPTNILRREGSWEHGSYVRFEETYDFAEAEMGAWMEIADTHGDYFRIDPEEEDGSRTCAMHRVFGESLCFRVDALSPGPLTTISATSIAQTSSEYSKDTRITIYGAQNARRMFLRSLKTARLVHDAN